MNKEQLLSYLKKLVVPVTIEELSHKLAITEYKIDYDLLQEYLVSLLKEGKIKFEVVRSF